MRIACRSVTENNDAHPYPTVFTRRSDKLTSVVIPLGLAGTTSLLWAKGMFNMYTGAGKLEDM